MIGLVKKGKGEDSLELMEFSLRNLSENDVLVKIHYTGICGTDLHIKKDEYPAEYPVVLGHEFSGEIVEKGKNVREFQLGDRVVSLTAAVTCENCEYCEQGMFMLCAQRKSIGSGIDGAFSPYLVLPASLLYHIPSNISYKEAALSEPLACVVRCVVERTDVKAGQQIIVSGPGTIGLLTMQVVQAHGAQVKMLGTSEDLERLQLAEKLGAEETIIVDTKEGSQRLKELGDSADIVFECSGAAPSAMTCLSIVKKQGHYTQVGLFGKNIEFDFDGALKKEITFSNGYASEPSSWRIALQLMEKGQIDLKSLVSDIYSLENWEKGFEKAESRGGLKVLLSP
ncbi:zinc-dependent alcohol dehydrogenase [Oceanobacillus timonensis]|uniref:zinc-dependent alcohol dehydrogenase n=1 Tax=Oceanobacillus timonensis TaxID=1926285 RepID=UPI0009B9A50D|nr:zinc-binding dehydrogenase [Oceanobacillus timonensis]